MNETVFCQITGRQITITTCFELQRVNPAEACVGCGACSRLCAQCRKYQPVCPEIGICAVCLPAILAKEKRKTKASEEKRKKEETYCQIVNKSIPVKMCLASQGCEGCTGCGVTSRLCEQCGDYCVFLQAYGLCLECAVQKFSPLCFQLHEETLQKIRTLTAGSSMWVNDLVQQAQDLVVSSGRANAKFFKKQLGVSWEKAQTLLSVLEQLQVVGPSQGRGRLSREVLLSPAQKETLQLNAPVCSSCREGKAMVSLDGRDVCIQCARKTHPLRWSQAFSQSAYRQLIMEQLFQEAMELLRDEEWATIELLQDRLLIGPSLGKVLMDRLLAEGAVSDTFHVANGHLVLPREDATSVFAPLVAKLTIEQCLACRKRPACSGVQEPPYCALCLRDKYGKEWAKHFSRLRQEAAALVLCERAEELLRGKSYVTARGLGEELGFSYSFIAHAVMERLQDAGLIGPYQNHLADGRRVLIPRRKVEENGQPQPSAIRTPRKRELLAALPVDDELYEQAKIIVIEHQQANAKFLMEQLGIPNKHRVLALLNRLEREGIILPGNQRFGWVRKSVLVPRPQAELIEDLEGRIAELEQLVTSLKEGNTHQLLSAVLSDLKKFKRLRRS